MATREDEVLAGLLGPRPGQRQEARRETDPRLAGLLGSTGQAPAQRGFFETLVDETLRDLEGAGKVLGAAALSPLDLMGASVPLTIEDLEQRDLTGALMVAALGAGGVAAGATRGALAARGIQATSVASRAGIFAGTEAVAGAAFGLVKPLEEDQERLEEILKETAFGAAFGAGFSLTGSAVKATVGQQLKNIREGVANSRLAQAANTFEAENFGRELAGTELRNPESGLRAFVHRNANNPDEVFLTFMGEDRAQTQTFSDFGEAVASATNRGFVDQAGPARTRLAGSELEELDAETLRSIAGPEGQIREQLHDIQLGQYQAVREALNQSELAQREVDALLGEVVTPSNELGLVDFSQKPEVRRSLINELGSQAADLDDPDLLREAIRKGIVNAEMLTAGVGQREFLSELFINGRVPGGLGARDVIVSRNSDVFMRVFRTAGNIAKAHPEVQPLYQLADERIRSLNNQLPKHQAFLEDLQNRVSPGAAERAVRIIDESQVAEDGAVRTIAEAREAALASARETGDDEVITFVERTTEKLNEFLERGQQAGILGEGRAGYFPIVNTNQWRLDVLEEGADRADFQGFFRTQKEALEEARRLEATLDNVRSVDVTPNAFWFDEDAVAGMDPKQFEQLRRAMKEAGSRKGTPFAKERVLGTRDFSKDPFESLQIYMNSVERAVQLSDFEPRARATLSQIPETKSNLRVWAENYIDRVMGRPTQTEKAFDALVQRLGIDAPPRALNRMGSMLRNWEFFSRLGGFMSGAVNMTQIVMNTFPVLGARWTAKGLEPIVSGPGAFTEARQIMADAGLDLGEAFLPFTSAGGAKRFARDFGVKVGGKEVPVGSIRQLMGSATIAAKQGSFDRARKNGVRAFTEMALFTFNGAEKLNRFSTAWGAFNRELSKGASRSEAAAVAREIVERTQFNYRLSNMPEILSGPAGKVIGQFKSFVVNEVEFIAGLNQQELARFGGAVWAMGGTSLLLNTPGADVLDAASEAFFGEKASEALKVRGAEAFPGAKLLVFGLPGAVDIDVSDYVGVGSLADITRGLFGPAVSDIQATGEFFMQAARDLHATDFTNISDETKRRFTQQVMPSAARRAIRGQDIAATGKVRNPYTGKLIYKPEDRAREAIITTIGFPTIRQQQERAADAIAARARRNYISVHGGFARGIAQALIDGDKQRAKQLQQESVRAGTPVDKRSIRRQVRELQTPARLRRQRRTPTTLRPELRDLFIGIGTNTPQAPQSTLDIPTS